MGVEDFLDFMPATVIITPYLSTALNGLKTYDVANPASYQARIQMKNHIVKDRTGRDVTARGTIFIGTTTIPSLDDLLTLPAGFTPLSPPMIDISPVYDDVGIHHIKVEIG